MGNIEYRVKSAEELSKCQEAMKIFNIHYTLDGCNLVVQKSNLNDNIVISPSESASKATRVRSLSKDKLGQMVVSSEDFVSIKIGEQEFDVYHKYKSGEK